MSPVVAATSSQPAPGTGSYPAAASGPVPAAATKHRDLLLVLLILLLFGFLYAQNGAPRQPRVLVGPRATGPPPAMPSTPRGLGRFAKARTEPPRPLI